MFKLKSWQVDVSTETLNFETYLSLSLSRRSFSRQALVPGGALDSGRDLFRGKDYRHTLLMSCASGQ
jgi:hypothetical protein